MAPEFGHPQTFGAALYNLPTREHPLYGVDENFEYLAHLRDFLLENTHQMESLTLEMRLIPPLLIVQEE